MDKQPDFIVDGTVNPFASSEKYRRAKMLAQSTAADRKRSWLEFSLENFRHNWLNIRREVPAQAGMIAVVKANAYGHGSLTIGREAVALGARALAIACVSEAEKLRDGGIDIPILVLGSMFAADLNRAQSLDLSLTVGSFEELALWLEWQKESGKKLNVHLKLDTGMGRLGFSAREADTEVIERLAKALKGQELEGVFTHFSDAADEEWTRVQYNRFTEAVNYLEDNGVRFKYRHCANSTGLTLYKDMAFDLVRPGIILYGACSDPGIKEKLQLKPVMSFLSRVVEIHDYPAGIPISYGRTFVTERDSRVAVIEAGYADGVMRSLSNRGTVSLPGGEAPIIGRVCMDRMMVDITDLPDVHGGDVAIIFGEYDGRVLDADKQAEAAGTISYELFCNVGNRLPRIIR